METFVSGISHKQYPVTQRVSGASVHTSVLKKIQTEHPEFTVDMDLTVHELAEYRKKYVTDVVTPKSGVLGEAEQRVIAAMNSDATLTNTLDNDTSASDSLGERLADRVADFGGSWTFILLFAVIILAWTFTNVFLLANKGFDPYPFILLNLVLSCVAALQAPVIMMSQNRQEAKDRTRAKKDYMVNLKSELEIRMLHEKLDYLTSIITRQQKEG